MTRRPTTRTLALAASGALALTTLVAPQASAAPSPDPAERATQLGTPFGTQGGAKGEAARSSSGDLDATRQAAIDRLVEDGGIGVVARVEGPKGEWAGGAGVRESGKKTPVHGQENFRVASNTKPMVATLVMQEIERGTWTLGTTVEEVLPGLLPGHGDVTIEQLLSHTSGMPTGDDMALALRMEDPSSFEEFFEVLGQDFEDQDVVDGALAAPWGFPDPQSPDWRYSNAGYVTLGMMLEEQTGESMERLLKDRVFKPAGMQQTRFETSSTVRGPFLVGGSFTDEGFWSERGFNPELFSSSGAVTSTTKDLNRFSEALVEGRLVDQALADQMTAFGDNAAGYGLGTYRMPDPCTPEGGEQQWLVGHDGGTYGTTSMMFSSLDGERQVSMGLTGRYLLESGQQPHDMVSAFFELAATTC